MCPKKTSLRYFRQAMTNEFCSQTPLGDLLQACLSTSRADDPTVGGGLMAGSWRTGR